jgi:hypothetical protein
MPIFVQWKWNEDTLTFLTVFHFFDDYIKTNIRFRTKRLEGGNDGRPAYLYYPIDHKGKSTRPAQFKSVMTWAPSHPELALLSELLSYANIINGMKENQKRKLIDILQVPVFAIGLSNWARNSALEYTKKGRFYLIGYEHDKPEDKLLCCAELCPEYIDYIKDFLKQFPKSPYALRSNDI